MENDNKQERRKSGLTEADAQLIAKHVLKEMNGQGFNLPAEKHYNDHKRVDEFLKVWEDAKSIWMRILLAAFLLGVFAVVILGIWKGKGP